MVFSEAEKLGRKQTIRSYNYMRLRERVLGIQATPPPYLLYQHPRRYNPPASCRSGKHNWTTTVLMGIPTLKCKKCGHIAMKGGFEGTETKRELRTRHVPKPSKVEWK